MSKTDGIGTWKWNSTYSGLSFTEFTVNFISNGVNYDAITATGTYIDYISGSDETRVYSNGWLDEKYRIIEFTVAPPTPMMNALTASAVYQEPAPQYLDEAGLKEFFVKTKAYVDKEVSTKITTRLTSINNMLTELDSGTGVS